MKMGNRTGWRWVAGTLTSLGFSLALAGVALASEAAHGGGHGTYGDMVRVSRRSL